MTEHCRQDTGEDGSIFKRTARIERFRRDLKKAGVVCQDEQGRYADFHSLRKTFCTNLARGGVPSRAAMTLMRHSDRRLTDVVYTDENLLSTWSAIDSLPSYTESPSQLLPQRASQKLVAAGHGVALAVTTGGGEDVGETIANIGDCRVLTPGVTTGHSGENGGSGGARTRNLCRDRAAL